MGKIVVDRGLEEFTIEDVSGKVLGKFSFNPADAEIAKRYKEVAHNFEHLLDDLDSDKDAEIFIEEAEKRVYAQIDYLFNAEVSESFFSITSPFSMLANGEYFLENVINAIGKLIEQKTGERFKKIEKKINKYSVKYHA